MLVNHSVNSNGANVANHNILGNIENTVAMHGQVPNELHMNEINNG